jgi:hypothetical protein
MPYINVVISEEAKAYLERRSGYQGRGKGSFVNALLLRDHERHAHQILEQRLRAKGLTSKEIWEVTGVAVD